jgi:polyhydroxyalkanoate synthesis regulator phasin
MAQNDGLKRYFEAALALSQVTRSRAEELVRDLIRTGEVESNQARDWVEDLVHTSRQRSEAFVGTVRTEVRRQLHDLGLTDVNEIARRVASILDKAETAARRAGRATAKRSRPAARKATARKTTKRAAAKKTAARKTAARKSPARNTTKKAAKRAPAKKAAKRAPAKKAGGTARRRS